MLQHTLDLPPPSASPWNGHATAILAPPCASAPAPCSRLPTGGQPGRWPATGCTNRASPRRSAAGWPPSAPTAWPACSSAPGDTGVFPPQDGQALVETLHQPPAAYGLAQPRWRLADLRAVCPAVAEYSLSDLSQALRRLGVRRHRGRLGIHSPDPDYAPKLAAIAAALALARAQPAGVSLVYADEFTLLRQPTLAAVWAAQGTEPVVRLSLRSTTRWRSSGALDAVTGRVTTHAAARMGVEELGRFLRRLRATYPDRRRILVWDNWSVHRHPAVLAVAAELGIEIRWLPTDAPWTNPIEKLWRWLKQDVVVAHRLAEQWPQLRGQVAAFLDQFADGSEALLRYVGLLPD